MTMSPTTLAAMAREIMQPLPSTVTPHTLASEALQVMQREDTRFLPVVTADAAKFLGVVLRQALERGCATMGHREAECLVISHLKADVDFCFQNEPALEVLKGSAIADRSVAVPHGTAARIRLRLPVIVVDERKAPIGMIERRAE
jgi:hypothetical protein